MYSSDLWLKDNSNWESLRDHVFSESWQIPWGGLRVNIAFKGDEPELLSNAITTIRSTRVGFEARYIPVAVWVDIQNVSESLLNILMHNDVFVPRLKLVLVCTPIISDMSKIVDLLVQVSNKKLLSTVLIVNPELGEEVLYYKQIIDYTLRSGTIYKVIVESFPLSIDATGSTVYKLIKQLQSVDYNFNKHVFFLCGVVSYICKTVFMHRVKASAMHDKEINSLPLTNIDQLKCSLECIKYCVKDQSFLEGCNCFCHFPITEVQFSNSIYQLITESFVDSEDQILFEDWQYIYDGFELT